MSRASHSKRCIHSLRHLLALAAGLAVSPPALGAPGISSNAPSDWALRRFDSRHGLAQNRVQALSRAPEGWIWCGSLRGLQRFDGRSFETLPNREFGAPESADITLVAAGPEEDLLVGYNYHHLVRRHRGRWGTVDTSKAGLPTGIRICVYLSRDLCVTCDSPPHKWIISRIEPLPSPAATSSAPAWTLRPLSTFASEIDLDCTLIQAGPGRALVRRANGSWLEIRGTAQPRPLPASEASTREDNFRRVQAADFGPQPWLYGDSNGLWLGSDRDGLIHLGPPAVEFWTHPQSTRSRNIQAIDASAEGSVWFIVEDRGNHAALHWRGGRFVGSNRTPSCSSIAALPDGSAFASGNQFTYAVTDLSVQARPLPSTSDRSHLSKGHSGRFWIASGTNLSESTNLRDWRTLELPRVPAIRNTTWLSVLELTNRDLWIGSIGFGALHLSNGVPFLHNTSNGAPSNILNPSLEDPDGTIWFGSTEGLVRYRRGRWFRFGPQHGLAESLALGVVDDLHGRLWVHGHQGIAGIHRSELEAVADGRSTQFRLFRPRDAAAWVTECNGGPPSSTRDSQGSLWFATIAGALRVPREQLVTTQRPAPTITSAADSGGVFWRDILQGSVSHLECPPDADQVLDFTLANPGRAESEMAPIQYRLDGVDQSWSTAPADGRIRYHHLSAGRLTLRIRSAEGGDAAESVISLSIPTRWYNTWSFRTISAGLFAALAGIYLQRRHARTRQLLEQEYRQQTQARRWQIARDLHDGIGVGLARISILASQSHPILSTTAQRLIRDLDELVWLTDPQRDGLNSAINYLVTAAERQLQGLPIELVFQIPDSFPDIQISGESRRHLIQIVHGALSNVIKHSRATRVEFRIVTTPKGITLEFIDNGCGFDPAQQPSERSGLRSFRERAARLDGTFSCQAAPGQGTRLAFVLSYANLSADLIAGSPPTSS